MATVEIKNVTKIFGRHIAVDDLSLTVPQGSIYGFIGPNGSGKTTTLRMIMGIIYPDNGSIRVFGEEMREGRSDRIGYMPEERGLYKRMKVRDVLQFYGELKSGRNVKQEVERWLEKLDLNGWRDQKVETLSKGMSQKAQFIATVVSQPELVILDEPFTGLDPVNTNVIREAILDLRAQGTTVILSTHDMQVAETMCDFIFMIFKGKKVLDGTLTSIQESYGQDTIRIRTEEGLPALQNIPAVDRINDFGQMQELHITQDCDPQGVLTEVMSRTRVKSFEIASPSLHDIFVRIAGPEAKELVFDPNKKFVENEEVRYA
jgi:ABC-2 type transport system ATP-binding protein